MTEASLSGRKSALLNLRILVVEDEMLIAMMVEDLLTTLGCDVVKAARVAKAAQLAEHEALDGAILDMNLAGEPVYPVAAALERRGIPFVFATGYGAEGIAPEWRHKQALAKPFKLKELTRVIAATFVGAA